MKNNGLMALALMLFLFIAWYRQFMVPMEEAKSIEGYKTEARERAQKGAPEMAIRLYEQALKVKDSIEDRKEVFEYYKKCIEEQSIEVNSRDMGAFVTKTMDLYADEELSYEMAMEYWMSEGNLTKCANIMKSAIAHDAVSDQLRQDFDGIKYTYRVNGNRYLGALHASEGIVPVQNGDQWTYFAANMSVVFERGFDQVSICNDARIAVQLGDLVKLLNARGETENVISLEGAQLAGAYGNGRVLVAKDGKYTYIDVDGETQFNLYDQAGAYINKRAAVRQGENWTVINTVGESVISDASAVAVDAYGRCAMAGRIMARKGSYGIYDTSGKKLVDLDAEDVKAFGEGTLAAACKNGRWGFIDTEGNWVIEPKYEDAESFSNGYGAVKSNGSWGFIDEEGREAVECRFEEVRNFTSEGKCLVYEDDFWKVLEFLCK